MTPPIAPEPLPPLPPLLPGEEGYSPGRETWTFFDPVSGEEIPDPN